MCRSGNTYCPDSEVRMVREAAVSTLVAVTFAPGIAEPDGSVMVPTTVASCAKAREDNPKNKTPSITAWRVLKDFNAWATADTHTDKRKFIFRPPPPVIWYHR